MRHNSRNVHEFFVDLSGDEEDDDEDEAADGDELLFWEGLEGVESSDQVFANVPHARRYSFGQAIASVRWSAAFHDS